MKRFRSAALALGLVVAVGNAEATAQPAASQSGAGASVAEAVTRAAVPGAASALAAQASSPPPSAWRFSLANLTRVESWSFFEPPPTGGDPTYTFIGNRLRLGVSRRWSHVDFAGAIQYVQFGGLPERASGPGALGTGALYYSHSGSTTSRQLYVKAVNLRARLPSGVSVLAGRFGYTAGAEAPSGHAKAESVKRARLDSRLLGEFEWSIYQRAFDGVRADVDRTRWHVTTAWMRPTQGGFEDASGLTMTDVGVAAATVTLRPGVAMPHSEVSAFVYRYDDDRPVRARPDNSGLAASRADVGVTTLGGAVVGAAEAGAGEFDWFGWFAGQTGNWYGQSHGAWSVAAEAGYQWKNVPWQPWLRAGHLAASGDRDPTDADHGTFFLMLPTVRRYAYTTAYAPTNLHDTFAEVAVRPSSRVLIKGDVRRLRLAESADRWYAGSGATSRSGTFFGYAARPSGGSTDFGHAVEGSADVRVHRHLALNGFIGAIDGGRVVTNLFAGSWLRYFYMEAAIQY